MTILHLLFQVGCTFSRFLLLISLTSFAMTCKPETGQKSNQKIDVQGHRGCRGLMPENTVAGFLHAIDLGVNTLEMDVVVSKDRIVIVSHEPHFNEEITTKPNKTYLTKDEADQSNLFAMDFAEIQRYDVGLKPHPRFPNQVKLAAAKPSLEEVIKSCEKKSEGKIQYNIEIKRTEGGDHKVQPSMPEFTDLVIQLIDETGIKERTTLQCFDPEVLNHIYIHRKDIKTILLVENLASMADNLNQLNHKPFAYSPAYKLVNQQMVDELHNKQIRLVPWTVNDSLAVATLIEMGVDGIISDYPDMVLKVIKN